VPEHYYNNKNQRQLARQEDGEERLDSDNKIKKSKCFIWYRLGARGPFFLSLSCTEFVPNFQSTQCRVILKGIK
jgi:hypothetical protein